MLLQVVTGKKCTMKPNIYNKYQKVHQKKSFKHCEKFKIFLYLIWFMKVMIIKNWYILLKKCVIAIIKACANVYKYFSQ